MFPPLVVGEPWDIEFFGSPEAVSRELEGWFPAAADYVAYDSEGRKLELAVERRRVPRRFLWSRWTVEVEQVVVRPLERDPEHAEELAELLREWLPRGGGPRLDGDASLSEVLAQALDYGELL